MDLVLIHGYSSSARAFERSLGETLLKANAARGTNAVPNLRLRYVDYVSLDDQVCLEDVAESLYLELERSGLLQGAGRTLRFIVHSTGGIVVRQLLKQYAWTGIDERIASIVFLAPANFGSPLAHKGRSQLGRLKTMVVDGLMEGDTYVTPWQFGEVGEPILKDLEMASPRQWDLSDHDLLHPQRGSLYGPDRINAWVFTGAKAGGLVALIADVRGTDGVITTSGAGLSIRRLTLDLVNGKRTQREADPGWSKQQRADRLPMVPQIVLDDLDHGTILTDEGVAEMVLDAVMADSEADRNAVAGRIPAIQARHRTASSEVYQQFVFRVRDDRGNPVPDYDVSFQVWSQSRLTSAGFAPLVGQPLFPTSVAAQQRLTYRDTDRTLTLDASLRRGAHRHSEGHHFRRFLVNLTELETLLGSDAVLTFSLVATTGDERIHYASEDVTDIVIHPSGAGEPSLFYPHTTTQVDVTIDRWSDQGSVVLLK